MLLNFYFFSILSLVLVFYKQRLYTIIVILLILIFKFNLVYTKLSLFYKSNFLENDVWFLVDLLNNNNKSILFFIFLFFYFNLIKFIKFIKLLKYSKTINVLILILSVLLYTKDTSYSLNFFVDIKNNTTLINGVILIHPILIYCSYITFIYICNIIVNTHKYNYIVYIVSEYKYNIYIVSFLGLFLGSFWAQQEINWGGWWNWDYVEIVALIFFILSLYIMHTNFIKNINNIYIISRNTMCYLFCFFFLVRVDVLNSIHSFNSLSISSNYKYFIIIFIMFLLWLLCLFYFNFFKKFYNNITTFNINILTIFFKFLNTFLFLYFIINVIVIFYLNFQFLEITKYIKIFIKLFLYLYILNTIYQYKNILLFNFLFLLALLGIELYMFYINTLDILCIGLILNITLYKNYIKKLNFNLFFISHYVFLIFIFLIKYDFFQIYDNNIIMSYYIKYYINNDYIVSKNNFYYLNSYLSQLNLCLQNFFYKSSFFNFFFYKNIYVNNIILTKYSYILYNLENSVSYIFYNIHLLLILLYIAAIILLFYK